MKSCSSVLGEIEACCASSAVPVVVIAIHQTMTKELLVQVGKRMNTDTIKPLIVCTEPEMAFTDVEFPFFHVAQEDLPKLKGPAVLLCMDLPPAADIAFPDIPKVIHMLHCLVDIPLKRDGRESIWDLHSRFPASDALFVAQPAALALPNKEKCDQMPYTGLERTGPYSVIVGGYPKFDLLLEGMTALNKERDTILVAPTADSRMVDMGCRQGEYGERCGTMIRAALEGDENAPVLFRPIPTETPENINIVMDQFADNPRVALDQGFTTIEAFAVSKLLITDRSLTRNTFSLVTGLPHVMFTDGASHVLDMGFAVNGFEEMRDTIALCLKNSVAWKKHIETMRPVKVANFGQGYQNLLETLEALAYGKTLDSWQTFERNYVEGDWSELSTWEKWHDALDFPFRLSTLTSPALRKRFPQNPFCLDCHGVLHEYGKALQINHADQTVSALPNRELGAYLRNPEKLPPFAIWGTGRDYRDKYRNLVLDHSDKFTGFFDGDPLKWGGILDGKMIHPPTGLFSCQPEIVFIASWAHEAITGRIMELFEVVGRALPKENG